MTDYRLFGGDAAKERARLWSRKWPGARVLRLIDDVDPRDFGLDMFARGGDGIIYSHVCVAAELSDYDYTRAEEDRARIADAREDWES